jgi:AraC-like DNA-binding protein
VALLAIALYYLRVYREAKNREILNLEIDYLTAQHKEMSESSKNLILGANEKPIESQDQRLLKAAIEVVEKNMKDPLFGVEKMAKEMGMSRTNMHRKIKAITGFPPSELIRSIRLRRAAVLLLNQADTVSQISLMVGFEDHSYFSKSFKKQFGVPPSEYHASVSQAEQLVTP